MKIHGEIRSNKPTTESDFIVNGVKITPKKSIMDTLQLAVPDEKKRKALVTLMGPEGCFFCPALLKRKKERVQGKALFPHLVSTVGPAKIKKEL